MAVPTLANLRALLQPPLCATQPIVLRESNPNATQQPVALRGTEPDREVLGLHFETGHAALGAASSDLPTWLFPLFTGGGGPRKSCDYVVMRETNSAIDILLIELKSSNTAEARHQIANTRLLVDHLLDTAAHWHGRQPPAQARAGSRRFRGIVFNASTSHKKVTGSAKVPFVSMPDMADVLWTTLPYLPHYQLHELLP